MRLLVVYFLAYVKSSYQSLIWVFLFSTLFFLVFFYCQKKGWTRKYNGKICCHIYGLLLALFCSFVFVMTLFGRTVVQGDTFDFKVFATYFEALTENNSELQLQIIMNIVMFIPIGFLLPSYFLIFERYRYVLVTVFICSISIECIQGIIKIGYFEVDDIINNTLGVSIGILIYMLFTKLKKILDKGSKSNYEANHQEIN